MRCRLPGWACAVACAIFYCALALGNVTLELRPEQVSLLWLPSGFLLAMLLLRPRHEWPLMIGLSVVGTCIADYTRHRSWETIAVYQFADVVGLLLAALMARPRGSRIPRLNRVKEAVRVYVAALVGSGIAGIVAGASVLLKEVKAPFEDVVLAFWLSTFVGMIVMTPFILALRHALRVRSRIHRPIEATFVAALVIGTSLYAFWLDPADGQLALGLIFLPLPALGIQVLRRSVVEVTGTFLVVAIGGAVASHLELGPTNALQLDATDRALWFQAFLGATGITTMILVSGTVDRVRTSRRLLLQHARVERLVKQRTRQLEIANQDLEAFTYTVSHDLRAPIRAMWGHAHALAEDHGDELGPDGLQAIESIEANSQRMSQLVEAMLAVSRSGRQRLKFERLEMSSLVEEIADRVVRTSNRPDVVVDVGELPPIEGDRTLIGQVFQNLIENAVKFTRRQAKPRIVVLGAAENGFAEFAVSDNGEGFDPAESERIFGLFERSHDEKQIEGSGVGLAIVKRIVERHGGSVSASSKSGEGATFKVRLPIQSTSSSKPSIPSG